MTLDFHLSNFLPQIVPEPGMNVLPSLVFTTFCKVGLLLNSTSQLLLKIMQILELALKGSDTGLLGLGLHLGIFTLNKTFQMVWMEVV